MNISQLEVFVTIVETGSLTEAGEVIGLTQSAVSYSLAKLEAELGVTLLERSRHGIAVTQIGEDVLQYAICEIELTKKVKELKILSDKTKNREFITDGKYRYRNNFDHSVCDSR